MNEEIKINSRWSEDIHKTNITFNLIYKGFEIEVLRQIVYSDDVGFLSDDISIIESDKELSEEEKREIINFVEEQKEDE